MNPVEPVHSTPVLLLIAAAAVLVLLVFIMRFRLHAFVSLVLVSLLTAIVAGIPMGDVIPTLLQGFGSTLATVALLVGFGAMIGRLLEITGGAQVLADRLIGQFGAERAPFALGVASLLFGFPIFFDAGLVVMLPIIFSVAYRFGGSVLLYALPAAGAFAAMHALLPPHPGPVAAGDLLGADIGLLVLVGLAVALPTWFFGSYLFGLWAGRRFVLPIPQILGAVDAGSHDRNPPSFGTVMLVLLLPLALIFLNTGLGTLATMGVVDGGAGWVTVLRLIGQTPIALLITVLVAMALLGRGRNAAEIEKIMDGALAPICAIILVTGAGGMFGGVLRASGIGEALAGSLDAIGMPLIVAAFVISMALRVAQGSATVALTTTAGLIAPTVAATTGLSEFDRCFLVVAIAGGATVLSHFNDSGFWLVGRFLEMDEKTTLKTWTVMETLLGTIAFGFALLGWWLL
ncbi:MULTISPECIES: GntP family permease [Paracoccus]|jgi:GntP family gluconate:H+ symporter|uniref:Gluconate transporter n=1 Tax=Paracoccus denitrificans (strain Pd 1222) TaxID=318586 RepID=A1B671_PARDP|nr:MULTISPECIES: GntP family permease [Paracoccus]ABL71015.1 gluconate transporter [Paracoccus denitrificans PD1222]MBB4626671.1 GntP family gluconate:H+ symporter [Paracoccus denitrificans]MCU7428686.1 GntP family permease [Paracoccus denitrificans]MDK8872821.1 GntP family permease [Paracoccus sp. SSJ]QAR27691.1 GntP family permease [Paracoccus denitrificans]